MKRGTFFLFSTAFLVLLIFSGSSYGEESYIKITNEMIYKKLLEIEKNQIRFEEKFKAIDQRFEEIDKRFDQIDKRFEQINKRFEDINKRFEDVNKRFEDLVHLFGIIAAVFGTLVAVVIGFAFWDRKTIIDVAKKETIKEIEKEGKLADLIISLRKLAQEDSRLREVLKTYHLL